MRAFADHPRFANHVRQGKQALKGEHRALLIERASAKVLTSLDFEQAVADQDLQHKRFDYFIQVAPNPEKCHAVEVHAFEPAVLAAKKAGTRLLLAKHCSAALEQTASWHVIIKGSMPRQDLAARFQADTKIVLAGRTLLVDSI